MPPMPDVAHTLQRCENHMRMTWSALERARLLVARCAAEEAAMTTDTTTYLGSGEESRQRRDYTPEWLANLADDVTMAASGARPRPDTAFFMTPTKSERVSVTVGIPRLSILAAARPHAVAQAPQLALPTMTASTPLFFTSLAVSSVPMWRLPWG